MMNPYNPELDYKILPARTKPTGTSKVWRPRLPSSAKDYQNKRKLFKLKKKLTIGEHSLEETSSGNGASELGDPVADDLKGRYVFVVW